jgi:hypothetical protein
MINEQNKKTLITLIKAAIAECGNTERLARAMGKTDLADNIRNIAQRNFLEYLELVEQDRMPPSGGRGYGIIRGLAELDIDVSGLSSTLFEAGVSVERFIKEQWT